MQQNVQGCMKSRTNALCGLQQYLHHRAHIKVGGVVQGGHVGPPTSDVHITATGNEQVRHATTLVHIPNAIGPGLADVVKEGHVCQAIAIIYVSSSLQDLHIPYV